MPTKSKRRKTKLGHQKMMVNMFRTPIQYLNWIMNSWSKDEHGQQKRHEEIILCNVVTSVLTKAMQNCTKIEKHFDLSDNKASLRSAVMDMIEEVNENEYRLRMFLKHLGVSGALEMVVGYPHNIDKNSAVVRFNQHLIIEERAALLRQMRPCMDRDFVSPAKITHWLYPVIHSALQEVHRKIIKGYGVRSFVMPSKDGLSALITCKSKDSDHSFTHKLTIDFAISVKNLPKNFSLQHPFPKSHPFPQKGREMIKEIRSSFGHGESRICLSASLLNKTPVPLWYTDGSLLSLSKRERNKRMLSVGDISLHSAENSSLDTLAVITGSKPHDDFLWTIDYDAIEMLIQSHVKDEPSYRVIQDAFRLYQILSTCKKKVVPMLNEKTKRALGLWLYKQSGDGDNNLMDVFIAVLNIVNKCIYNGFCPSFCEPNVNTMDEREVSDLFEGSGVSDVEEPNSIEQLLDLLEEGNMKELIEFIDIM